MPTVLTYTSVITPVNAPLPLISVLHSVSIVVALAFVATLALDVLALLLFAAACTSGAIPCVAGLNPWPSAIAPAAIVPK